MINAKPRFALTGEGDQVRLYDYAKAEYVLPIGTLRDEFGAWDLHVVAALIASNQTIERAFTAGPAPKAD